MRLRQHQGRLVGPKLFISRCDSPEPITVSDEGIQPDEDNEKWVHEGTFLDKDGKAITLTKGEGLEFSADPIGILTEAVNVTDGAQGGSLMRSGVIYADKLPYPEGVEYDDSFKASIEAKLPHILCVGSRTPVTTGSSSSSSSVNFDLSKATGTLGVDKGGTGATSASEALSALLESQPLSVENGGTGKGTASEALDALLESQPLPITKGGTGASDKETAVTNLGAQKAE